MNVFNSVLSSFGNVLTLVFWFIVILIPLVVIHEFGHTIMAWITKMRVVEFGVNMPPRTKLKFRKRGMLWSLNWLPLGGFAKLYGDHDALDTAVSDSTTKSKTEVIDQYKRDRLLEVVDADLPQLLINNGLAYDKTWQTWEQLMQSHSWIAKQVYETGVVPTDFVTLANGKPVKKLISESDQKQLSVGLKQIMQLVEWEFEGQKNTKTAFFNRGFLPKFLVLIGGVLFNYLFAWLLIFVLLNTSSIPALYNKDQDAPKLSTNTVVSSQKLNEIIRVADNTPLKAAGVPDRSKLVSYNGKTIAQYDSFEMFRQQVESTQGNPAELVYRDPKTNEQKTVSISAAKKENEPYKIGAVLFTQVNYKSKDFLSSFAATTDEVNSSVSRIWNGLGDVAKALLPSTQDKSALQAVGGPVAIAGAGSVTYDLLGLSGVLHIMALISLSLAIFNLLPLPVLDGGRIVLALINKITGNRNRKIEAYLINGTMIVLLALFAFIAYRDVGLVSSIFR